MSVLEDHRTTIATALNTGGIEAHTTVPAKWTPPGAFVGPGDPYITRQINGVSFGGEVANFLVTVVTERGTNDERANDLDDLILKTLDVLDGLEGQGFGVGDVQQPGELLVNNQPHLGVAVEVAIEINRRHS